MSELFDYIALNYWTFLFVFLRLSAFFLAFPFLSTTFVPVRVKVALLLAFSFFFSSSLNLHLVPPKSLLDFSFIALKEVILGFLLALMAYIFYGIVSYAGELISYMMGLTVANLFDPTFGLVSLTGRLFIFTFYLVFFATGGAEYFVGVLYKSFLLLPVGQISLNGSFFKFLVKESSLIFSLGFKMAFPFIFVLFITNLALALVNRLIPQINVFIVGLPLQIFVGLFFLSIGFSVIVFFMVNLSQRFVEDLFILIKVVKGG